MNKTLFLKALGWLACLGLVFLMCFQKSHAESLSDDAHFLPSFSKHRNGLLNLIGEKQLSNTLTFQKTAVGGLSGLDYNPKTGKWIFISDDPSVLGPARFYTAKLDYDATGFQAITLDTMTPLKDPNGKPYPNLRQFVVTHNGVVPDFESIRFDPKDGSIWYTSEGNRDLGFNPFIFHSDIEGHYLSSFLIPKAYAINKKAQQGIQPNKAIEGSSFTPNGHAYFTAMEGPLLQDDPPVSDKTNTWSRITKYNRQGEIVAEYVYPLSPTMKTEKNGPVLQNGISDLLAINNHQFLVLERASGRNETGQPIFSIRLYKIDIRKATSIHPAQKLQSKTFTPVKKTLVLDFKTLNLPKIGNIEGLAWGPKLTNGDDSLVFISDNNFDANEVTQFIAFDVVPK